MKVKDLLPQQVITADVDTSLQDVARRMRNHRVGILPILQGSRLASVLTDRDVTVRALAATPDCGRLKARDIMTERAVTIDEDADVEEAAVLMRQHRLHRIIVTRPCGSVAGVISLTDLSLLDQDAFEVLRRLSERPVVEQFPEEDVTVPHILTG